MSELLSLEGREEHLVDRIASGLGYVTVICGYLFTILTTAHLTLFTFLLFTFLQVGYSLLLWWMIRSVWQGATSWHIALSALLLVGITVIVGLMPLMGLQWDWLLFLATVSTLFSLLPLWTALGTSVVLSGLMVANLLVIADGRWSLVYPTLLQLLPALAFVAVFSLLLHFRWVRGDRTERLLHQLAESNAQLERAHRQLQAYAEEVEELTIVRERTRVAREIHDTLGHHLSILNIQLETISKLQERDPARAAVEVAVARRVAMQSMQEVRNAIAALRSASIATLNLPQALTQLAHEFEGSMEEIQTTLDLETALPHLSPDVQVTFYRAAQEAFTNVRKHSRASKVLVRLRYEDETLELLVLDNGCGNASGEKKGGFGLLGLRERVALLGGQAVSGRTERGGFRVVVRVPISSKVREDSREPDNVQQETESQGVPPRKG